MDQWRWPHLTQVTEKGFNIILHGWLPRRKFTCKFLPIWHLSQMNNGKVEVWRKLKRGKNSIKWFELLKNCIFNLSYRPPPSKEGAMLYPTLMVVGRWEKEYERFSLESHLECQAAGMFHFRILLDWAINLGNMMAPKILAAPSTILSWALTLQMWEGSRRGEGSVIGTLILDICTCLKWQKEEKIKEEWTRESERS